MKIMHIKIPQTNGPVMDALKNRWSPRSFADRAISVADMETIIEAGTWAFSCANEQPWRFIIGHRGTPLFDQLVGLLAPGNQIWAKDAAVLVLTMVYTKMANGSPNPWAQHDLGAANFAMALQANHLEIYNHVMAGFDKARSVVDMGLAADIEPIAMMAFGYLGAAEALPEPFLSREGTPRSRKTVAEVVLKHD